MSDLALSLVVSTVGRPAELARLVRSVEVSTAASEVELVVVDQSDDRSCLRMLEAAPPRVAWTGTTSGRGLSVGRNVGLARATGQVVAFPDDDCWYPATVLASALQRLRAEPGLAGLSARQATEDGRDSMLRWHREPGAVTGRNFFHTMISSTLFLRRSAVDRAGGFDETLGAGSAGPWRSGEETDLVLRILALGLEVAYDPRLTVLQDEPRDEPDPLFAEKMAGYGAGLGRLWRLHRLSPPVFGYLAARKLAGGAVRTLRGRPDLGRSDLAYVRGMLAGVRSPAPRR
ncbi:glycosyltransferase family 2 protein [Motilibacter deserti]|uniref:Glycosyltransferase n=1 Tax=Motilibacter deserti TaxID=2714956 RepID=A0ABX0GUC1_9ACTN|nr:glycosyltransferase [Motilibacter deserti]